MLIHVMKVLSYDFFMLISLCQKALIGAHNGTRDLKVPCSQILVLDASTFNSEASKHSTEADGSSSTSCGSGAPGRI